jgi:ureidoacrylate peracid hydrolase
MTSTASSVDALLIIDMQNSFCDPAGVMYAPFGEPLFEIEGVVTNTAAAVDAARRAGLPVVFTRHQYQPGHADFGRLFPQYLELLRDRQGLLAGTWDVAVIDELNQSGDDLVVDKPRLDAFHGTSLDTLLHGLGARRIAVAGVMTNACVETTTRSAAMRDYQVTLLSDCTTSQQENHRDMSLECLEAYHLAAVRPFSEALFASS